MTARSTVGEREQCCKDVCSRCQAEEGLRRTPDGVWSHIRFALEATEHGTITEPRGTPCAAAAIHERAWGERLQRISQIADPDDEC